MATRISLTLERSFLVAIGQEVNGNLCNGKAYTHKKPDKGYKLPFLYPKFKTRFVVPLQMIYKQVYTPDVDRNT